MTTVQDVMWRMRNLDTMTVVSVEELYAQLMEHLNDRYTDPVEAINKATQLLAKYYLNIQE